MKRKSILYYLGNLFIVLSLLGFTYTVYPLIRIYFFPPAPPENTEIINKGFYLSIPKIHAYSEVIPNVDPWDQIVYNAALKNGIAHAKGTKLPGEHGTIFLFAHSSGNPWEVTHTNSIFLRLGELDTGDKFQLDYKGKRYKYSVSDKKEIWPTDVQYLENTDDDILILQTCTPIGTSLKRLLIFAKHYN